MFRLSFLPEVGGLETDDGAAVRLGETGLRVCGEPGRTFWGDADLC